MRRDHDVLEKLAETGFDGPLTRTTEDNGTKPAGISVTAPS
jgi:hypothetical protein